MKRLTMVIGLAVVTAWQTANAVSDIADIEGKMIFTYEQLYNDDGYIDGGGVVTIDAIEGTDSITITDFYSTGVVIKAKVDMENKTISIPNQVIGTHTSLGEYDICYCEWDSDDESATVDRTSDITGTITDDGLISIDAAWGVFSTAKNAIFGVFSGIVSYHSNARMIYTYYDTTAQEAAVDTILIYAYQEDEIVNLVNFYNYGNTIKATLNGAKRATLARSLVFYGKYSNAVLYGADFEGDYTQFSESQLYYPLLTEVATDLRTISWGEWTITCDDYFYYFAGINGRIETDFDLVYPDAIDLTVEGEGTAESPYLIKTVDDWNNLIEYGGEMYETFEGKYIKIDNDFSFTDNTIVPFGYTNGVVFSGDLDGGGHTVSGISYTTKSQSAGAIVTYASGANIHDITLEGSVTLSQYYCGGVVGMLSNSTLSNITNKMTVKATSYYAGGIVGNPLNSTITGCVFAGTMTATSMNSGGVIGYARNSNVITGCSNKGDITFNGTNSGGVVGYFDGIDGMCVSDCHNYGSVTANNSYIGGVIGLCVVSTSVATGDPDLAVVVENCNNYGTVITKSRCTGGVIGWANKGIISDCHNYGIISSTNYATGGVVGYGYQTTIVDCSNESYVTSSYQIPAGVVGTTTGSTITGCVNNGTVTMNSISGEGASGVIGYVYGTSTVTDCVNNGNVTSAGHVIGGIIATLADECTVTYCQNLGEISGAGDCVGGIIGYNNGSVEVSNCYNAGTINGEGNQVGGMIGYDYEGTSTINGCYNLGDVTSLTDYVGGITGYSHSTITNVYNTGVVSGQNYVAGISGYVDGTITCCYSTGSVAATGTEFGNLVTAADVVSDGYYLTEKDCGGVSVGSGLTYSELASLELDGWINGDDYTYPILADVDYAKVYAAAIIPADGDSYENITKDFKVGTPDGLTWTASTEDLSIDDNDVTFVNSFSGPLTLTATCGDVVVTTELYCNAVVDGITNIQAGDGRQPVSKRFYTTSGVEVSGAEDVAGQILIVVTTYDDGTTAVTKRAY